MKINELADHNETNANFDIIDDVIVFMRNDPKFYRKKYFPTMARLSDAHRQGMDVDAHSEMSPMIDSGLNTYCKKYKIARSPSDIFTIEDRAAIMDRVYSEEMENIRKGDYT